MNSTFTFDETRHLRHRILWRNGYQHIDMVRSTMAFQYVSFFLIHEVLEHLIPNTSATPHKIIIFFLYFGIRKIHQY